LGPSTYFNAEASSFKFGTQLGTKIGGGLGKTLDSRRVWSDTTKSVALYESNRSLYLHDKLTAQHRESK